MNTQEKLIFLLRDFIVGGVSDVGAIDVGAIDENELKALYRLAKKHDVAHLIGAELTKLGVLASFADCEAAKLFEKEQMLAVFRSENLQHETEEICKSLGGAGIAHVPLKGAVIRSYYPESWMRTSCDIDVLVREEDLEKACDSLVNELSYSVRGNKDYHDISLYSPSGFHLELHYHIKENTPVMDKVLERVWDYTGHSEGKCSYLTDEFLMFHLIAHTAYHFVGGGCGIRPIIDLYYLRKALKIDPEIFARLIKESGLDAFNENLNSLCDFWFCGGKEAPLTKEIEDYIFSGGVYGCAQQNIAVKRINKGSGKYIASRLFMPYESLTILYPSLKGKRALTPAYEVARWFKICRKDVRGKVKTEIDANSAMDADKIEQMRLLLKRLGLDSHVK